MKYRALNIFNFLTSETCQDDMLDPIKICGKGATSCYGTLANVTCECDNANGYVQSPDGRSCKPCKCSIT